MWTTENEVDFVSRLGTGDFNEGNLPRLPRIKALKGYLDGTKLRNKWKDRESGLDIDKLFVIKFARGLLKTLKGAGCRV